MTESRMPFRMGQLSSHIYDANRLVLIGPMLKKKMNESALSTLGLLTTPQIALDGGIKYAPRPDLWVGDGDSAGVVHPDIPYFAKLNQDETDFQFCLQQIHSWAWSELHIFGMLGGRRDHEWANLGAVYSAAKYKAGFRKAIFYGSCFESEFYILPKGETKIQIEGLFSLLAFEPAVVTLSGQCQYPANKIELEPFSGRGISNLGFGLINVESNVPMLIYLTENAEGRI